MIRSILEVIFMMIPYAAVGWIALVAGYNHGYTKGYINAIEDVEKTKHRPRTFAEDNSEGETPREAAGVSPEVAPVQQERNIWEINPTHRGKK